MAYTVNRESLRDALRIMLEDTDEATPKWTDAALNQCIGDAIVLHTTEVPFAASESVAVSGNTYDYPDLAVRVHRVQATIDSASRFIDEADRDIFMGLWETGDEPVCFIPNYPAEGQYYLPRTPGGSTMTVFYGARLEEPADDGTSIDLAQRAWAAKAILRLSGALAFDPKSSARANLEQWASTIDQRVDNPLDQEAKRWYALYDELVLKYAQALSFAMR